MNKQDDISKTGRERRQDAEYIDHSRKKQFPDIVNGRTA